MGGVVDRVDDRDVLDDAVITSVIDCGAVVRHLEHPTGSSVSPVLGEAFERAGTGAARTRGFLAFLFSLRVMWVHHGD